MKTPEELATEYAKTKYECEYFVAKDAFLAGYQAAQEHAHAALEEAEVRMQELQDQLTDASSIMPQWNYMYDKDGLTGEKYWPSDRSLVVCVNAHGELILDFKCHTCDKIMYWIELPPIPYCKRNK